MLTDNFEIKAGIDKSNFEDAAALYAEAFAQKLKIALGQDEVIKAFFSKNLNSDFAFSAVSGKGELLGLAGFKTKEGSLIGGGFQSLKSHYGIFEALWRAPLISLLERPIEKDILLMDGICVRSEARSLGLGSALLNAICEEAEKRKCHQVRLDVISSNPRAMALYERFGFKRHKESKNLIAYLLFGIECSYEYKKDI